MFVVIALAPSHNLDSNMVTMVSQKSIVRCAISLLNRKRNNIRTKINAKPQSNKRDNGSHTIAAAIVSCKRFQERWLT
jgi:hypothetical protein